MSEEVKHCTSCHTLIPTTAKFCANCGAKAEQFISKNKNTCVCGAELQPDAKFCLECGNKLAKEIPNTILCSCGTELTPDAKFCTDCGKQLGMKPKPVNSPKKKSKKKLKGCITYIVLILMLLGANYYVFFYMNAIKKTHLASYEILPNDSIETVIRYNDEVTISIPPGALKQKDLLHLYSVGNLDVPECAESVLRTYDFDFEETENFDEEVEVTFFYKNELAENKIASDQSVYVMYYNEETKEWEDTNTIINKQNNSVRVFRSHFSSLGVVKTSTKPGPMMRANSLNDPATIDYAPNFSKAREIIANYTNKVKATDKNAANAQEIIGNYSNKVKEVHQNAAKEADRNAVKDGIDYFLLSFDITAHAADIHEQLLKFKTYEKFNKISGLLTITKAAVTLGIEVGEERYIDAIVNVTKTAIGVGAAVAGWKFYVIYNVAIFLSDLYFDKLDEEAKELQKLNIWADYYKYNANENPYKKSIREWSEYIANTIEDSADFEFELEQEVKKYAQAWFDENPEGPKEIKEALYAHESNRMKSVIKEAMLEYSKGLKEKQEQALIQYLFDMKEFMNSSNTIHVMVYGAKVGSEAVRNLPVTIKVNKNQELWKGKTDRGGQLYFKCTQLGYLAYECPTVVEVAYKDTIYEGIIKINDYSNTAETVRIHLEEEEEEEEEEEVANYEKLAGEYTGLLHDYDYFVGNEQMTAMSKFMRKYMTESMKAYKSEITLTIDKYGNIDATIVSSYGNEEDVAGSFSGAFGGANGNENFASFDMNSTGMMKVGKYDSNVEILYENGIMKVTIHSRILHKGKVILETQSYYNATKK